MRTQNNPKTTPNGKPETGGVWLNVEQTKDYLCLRSKSMVYALVRTHAIPYYRIGQRCLRFKRVELDAYLESTKVNALY